MLQTQAKTVGEGAFGCVLSPAFPCQSGDGDFNNSLAANPSLYVGKLFSDDQDADEEWLRAARFRAIDPEGTFCIVPTVHCPVSATDASLSMCTKNRSKFKMAKKKTATLPQLASANGGNTLKTMITRTLLSPKKLLMSLTNIVTVGLPAMAQAGLGHLDIKLDNVLYNNGTSHLIDFGISLTFNEIRASLYDSLAHSPLYPPEYGAIREARPQLVDQNADMFETLGISSRDGDEYRMLNGRAYNKFSWDWSRLLASGKSPDFIGQLLLVDKIDVYSMGLMVATMLRIANGTAGRTSNEHIKLLLWIANVVRANPFFRWTPQASAAYWNCIWDKRVTVRAAADLAKALSQKETVRLRGIVTTIILESSAPTADFEFYSSVPKVSQIPAFEGVTASIRAGGRACKRRSTSRRRGKK